MSRTIAPSPPFAVTSVILSMALLAVGNGLLFTYVPIKLAAEGFEPWVAGAIITAMAGGSFIGCIVTGRLVGRVGHARVFATLAAVINLAVLIIALGTDPMLWVIARGLYGFAGAGIFVVAQSWLNDASPNEWRGKVIATFYMSYVLCIGIGSYLLTFVSIDGQQVPLVAIFFGTIAILPVGLTRLQTPPPPESVSIAVRSVWKISPVALVGLLAVGGLTMLVQGFAPVYAASENYSKNDIALLMFFMQFGMLGIQLPLGAISDRTDRRYVLIAACLIVVASAGVATQLNGTGLVLLILVFAIWGGATESIYAVASAHANDRAEPQYYVSLSSTLMVAWSVSGFILPGFTTVLVQILGPQAFMYVAIAVAAAYAAFVVFRLTQRDPVEQDETEPYQPISAQAPYTPELAPLASDDDAAG